MEKLTAESLRQKLWETLNGVKSKKVEPYAAAAIAAQSREILRSLKTQLQILGADPAKTTKAMRDFAGD